MHMHMSDDRGLIKAGPAHAPQNESPGTGRSFKTRVFVTL